MQENEGCCRNQLLSYICENPKLNQVFKFYSFRQ